MIVNTYVVSDMETKCYLLFDEKSGEMAVVDPGGYSDALLNEIEKNGKNLKYILLTHGHFDHIGIASELKSKYNAKIVCNKAENELIKSELMNLSKFFGKMKETVIPDILLNANDIVLLGSTKIKIISTPGHTVGSSCYLAENILFSGDTIMKETIGRTDFPTGDYHQMMNSVKKIAAMPDELNIYPGHGEKSILQHEKKYNQYFEQRDNEHIY
ncbi:MAG: MBL fold metallo-hydrolase [Bacillota bacterium]|nr:MBL fold metallo-hydrolase [Bacillota bacterium]